jgi:hypothetical protein
MTPYIIAMSFISWMVMIMMILGLLLITVWKFGSEDDLETQAFLEDYYTSSFAGKVTKLLFFGAFFFATLISVLRGDFKDE